MKSQHFCDFGGPCHLWHLGFFTDHLKLVKSIPGNSKMVEVFTVNCFRLKCSLYPNSSINKKITHM